MRFKIIYSIFILSFYLQALENNITKGLFLDPIKDKQRLLTMPDRSDDKSIKRFRYIDINMTLLPQKISTNSIGKKSTLSSKKIPTQEILVSLNFFDNQQYTAKITKISKSSATSTTIWSGNIIGMKYSHVSIANTDGVLSGSIRTEDGVLFKIVYAGNGLHSIQEIDESKLPKVEEPLNPSIPLSAALTVPQENVDSGETIDIMVLYTPAARIGAGGVAAIESIINSSVATMNTAFLNSNIATEVRLVHTEEVFGRGETGLSSGFTTALNDLKGTTDGYMDNIHQLRDIYHADMVQLLFDNSSLGGLAWIMTTPSASFESSAFSVVHYSYADGWAFDHEFGHNMGMSHDRENSNFEGSYSYSYGYQSSTNAWHTIMAYDCVGGCPRVDYWANPSIIYGRELLGSPIGTINEADAYTTISNNLNIIANWRVSVPVPDLIIGEITIESTDITTGQTVSVDALVVNQGDAISESTTLRYYLSTDTIINSSDIELSSHLVSALESGGSSLYPTSVTAPLNEGKYYFGVCIDSVNTELAILNNCSNVLQVQVVLDSDGDGVADTVDIDDDNDGYKDSDEITAGSNPLDMTSVPVDTDGDYISNITDTDDDNDGISDINELANGLNPLNALDAQEDFDNDSFSNALEIFLGSDIRNNKSKPIWNPIIMEKIIIFVPSFP